MGMNIYNKIATSSIGLTLAMAVSTSHAQSLMEIYNLAVGNDPQFKAAQANLAAAEEALPQSTAKFLPSLFASASRIEDSDSDVDSADSYSLRLNQPLYRHGNFVQRRTAKSSVAQSKAAFTSAEQNLVLDVARAYFGVLSAQDGLDFAEAEKQANARQLEQTQQRFDVGLVAITDVHESRAAYDISVAQAIAAENSLDSANESLREITGSYHEALDSLDENMPLVAPDPASLEEWTKKAMEENAELKATHESTEQAREFVKSQQSNNYPILDLVVNHSKYKGGSTIGGVPTTTDTDSTTATLQLSMWLFEGGGTQSRIQQAREYLKASRQYLEQTKRATQRKVRNAYRGILSGISRVKALKQAMVSSQSALRAAEAGYEVGTRTTVDVLVARRNLFLAQRDYAQARYDYLINKLALRQAAGTLNSTHLNDVAKWLR